MFKPINSNAHEISCAGDTYRAYNKPGAKIDKAYLEDYLREYLGDCYDQTKVDRGDDGARLWYWGESMYGGYYAEAWVICTLVGFHADTLRDLRVQLSRLGLKTSNRRRWDH